MLRGTQPHNMHHFLYERPWLVLLT
eukprot:SAG31_NODE_17704_length_660_cov_1.659537_1_plen_24_part_10